ncbi:AAA family ATPase [Rhizobium sp. BR 314]|uniref:AAA family ATPase n=1 Tax=Rhizobium sp. BR 314 TaxID=3040013 RepID=UPI0039BF74E0
MFFKVIPNNSRLPVGAKNQAILFVDNWDDWFKFATMYVLFYYDEAGEQHRIGEVKIGQFGLTPNERRPSIPNEFNALSTEYFSLGQDDSYYEKLNELGDELRDTILASLCDVAFDEELFERALNEPVMGVSLLRSVSRSAVRGQFRRIAKGGARLTSYAFTYHCPEQKKTKLAAIEFSFKVEPESNPPTNIHVLIGRNGVGKTHHLQLMTRALVEENPDRSELGYFKNDEDLLEIFENSAEPIFENIVSVTFSAFDPFEPLPIRQNKSEGVRYQYVGLKKTTQTADGTTRSPKTPSNLGRDFGASIKVILAQAPKIVRWRRALSVLEADPIFKEANIASLAEETDEGDDEAIRTSASNIFLRLSSGHKIVLLTISRLVETVEERTLVLLDEPEAHLHPPLLSAFIRALSDLLTSRNGVAIIATHSPVVLQEVPSSCVWKIRRTGREMAVERPEIQTFGENVGILTREIFGLEVTDTGFHQLLNRKVATEGEYDAVLQSFDGQLGAEARAIVQGLLAARGGSEAD